MFDRNNKLNPILAMAIQARSSEERQSDLDEQAARAERVIARHFRQLGSASEHSISTGIPTVCTIH